MDRVRITQNLAVVESHFHSEALNESKWRSRRLQTTSFGKHLPQTALIDRSRERKLLQGITGNSLLPCVM